VSGNGVPVHFLRRNDTVWIPRYWLFFDSESVWHTGERSEVHSLRCWTAEFHELDPSTGNTIHCREFRGTTRDEFYAAITECLKGKRSLWLCAHNLNFDLQLLGIPDMLIDAGWKLGRFAVTSSAIWMTWKTTHRTITIVDSTSWLPKPLEVIGQAIGTRKPSLPDNSDSLDEWYTRCAGDVRILADAMLQLVQYWAQHKLGRWRPTGAGCGFAAMRHIISERSILIHPNEQWSAIEHAAIYGGFRWTGRVGELHDGLYVELDFVRAYATIASSLQLPTARVFVDDKPTLESLRDMMQHFGAIAEVTVVADRPRYPVRIDGLVYYPEGVMRTVLAGDEIRSALERGHIVDVHRVHYYRLGDALQPWAKWILDILNRQATHDIGAVQLAAKSWSRSVLGKFAARVPEFEDRGFWPEKHFRIEPHLELPSGKVGYAIFGGWKLIIQSGGRDVDNSFPAIFAFIEAATRTRITAAIDHIGWHRIITADTDGIVVDMADLITAYQDSHPEYRSHSTAANIVDRILDNMAGVTTPLRARPKALNRHLEVRGPQNVEGDETVKRSGIPRGARRSTSGEYEFHAWPSLIWQLQHSRPGEYVRPLRRIKISTLNASGNICDDGIVEPWTVWITDDGRTEIETRARVERVHAIAMMLGVSPADVTASN